MKIFLLALLIVIAVADNYVVEKTTVGSVDIYYPAACSEDNYSSGTKIPGVIISLGANIDKSYYSDIASRIAEDGYIVAVPTAVFFPFLNVNASTPQLLNATRAFLILQASNSTSPIFGMLDINNFHILGHSLGGTLAIVAASKNAQVICNGSPLAVFCAGYTGNGSEYRSVGAFATSFVFGPPPFIVADNSAAITLILGTTDARVSNASVATTYSLLLVAPKVFVTVDGVNHLGITDTQNITGQVNNGEQKKSQSWSISMISKASVTLFNAYGKNSTSSHRKLYVTKDLGPKALTVVASQA